jgi:hypothetical protein
MEERHLKAVYAEMQIGYEVERRERNRRIRESCRHPVPVAGFPNGGPRPSATSHQRPDSVLRGPQERAMLDIFEVVP